MDVQRIAAFSQGPTGGNPAGVVLLQEEINASEMARIAAEVGYSETAFAVAQDTAGSAWRVRYFSPESEVPFCGLRDHSAWCRPWAAPRPRHLCTGAQQQRHYS